jgi:hypothetical protein
MVGAILIRNHLQFTLQQVVVDVEGSPLIVKVGLAKYWLSTPLHPNHSQKWRTVIFLPNFIMCLTTTRTR